MELNVKLEGISIEDIQKIENILNIKINAKKNQQQTRADINLLSVGFILGVLKITPTLIKEISNVLLEIRKSKYFTIKASLDNGKTIIEGSASQELILELAKELNKLNKNNDVKVK